MNHNSISLLDGNLIIYKGLLYKLKRYPNAQLRRILRDDYWLTHSEQNAVISKIHKIIEQEQIQSGNHLTNLFKKN
jgi:hypothetical protein